MKFLSIVSGAYNEEDNVREFHARVTRVMAEQLPEYDYEFLIIDNASEDRTVEALREIAETDSHLTVIVNNRNFGHIRSGLHVLRQATGQAIIALASDLEDPPEMIPQFVRKWEEGYKIVLAQKTGGEEFLLFRLIRKAYYNIVTTLSEIPLVKDATGFGLYDKCVMDDLKATGDPYPYFRGLICDLGYPRFLIPFFKPARKRGISKNNFYTLYDMAILGITSHSKVPLRLATFAGFALGAFSLVIAFGYLLYKLFFWNNFSVGTAPIIIGIFFFGAIQLFFIGILGEYIGSMHTHIMNRPAATEKERIHFGPAHPLAASEAPAEFPVLRRNCAICDGSEKQPLFQQPLELPKGRTRYAGYEVVACARCGFVFADATVDQEYLDQHYAGPSSAAQALATHGEPAVDLARLEATAEFLATVVQPHWRVLDVGCGSGKLLVSLRNNGISHVEGLDQSPAAVDRAAAAGVLVHKGSVFHFSGGDFDFVIASHVMEHVVDLPAFVARLYAAVAPGGMLYVEVPDAANCRRHLDPKSPDTWIFGRELFTHFTPEHVNFFSAQSLRNLMQRFGFIEERILSTPLGALGSLWRRPPLDRDQVTVAEMAAYTEASRELQAPALRVIRELAASGREILVWGSRTAHPAITGQRRTSSSPHPRLHRSRCRIAGAALGGRPIIAPENIPAGLPILISSYKAEDAIVEAARRMNLSNEIIRLYAEQPATPAISS